MAEKNNATCAICGKEYYMCASCKDKMSAEPWKVHTDTSEHYKVFQIVRGYSIGLYDKNEAKDKLKNVNLFDLDTFKPEIKKVVKDILNSGEVEKHRSFNRKKEIKFNNVESNCVNENLLVETEAKPEIENVAQENEDIITE